MNASHPHATLAPRMPAPVPAAGPSANTRYRERSVGSGYGRSSGYASDRRYTSDWGQVRFRCG